MSSNGKKFAPLSGREMPRFAGLKTFFRLPYADLTEDFEVGLVGIPFDGGASYRSGQRFGPARVREISSLGRAFHMGRMQSFVDRLRVADCGDIPITPIHLEQTYQHIQNWMRSALATQKRFLAVGGDHSITLPILRELRSHLGQPIRLIHFDAHFDTYPAAWGCEYHHGAFVRHAVNEGLIDAKGSVQIGIRGPLAGADDLDFVNQSGLTVFTVDDIRRRQGVFDFVAALPDFGSDPVYISYDVDCLDPAFAPGTGTPVPGGLTTFETQTIFRHLKVKNLIGADVVETLPAYDSSDITALAAMDALFEILALAAGAKK